MGVMSEQKQIPGVMLASGDAGRIAVNIDLVGFSLDADEVARIDAMPGR